MTTPEDPTPPVPLTPQHLEVGMRAFFRIAALWQLSEAEQLALLGITSSSILDGLKAGGIADIGAETIERLGSVFGIFRAINIIMQHPDRADAWMRRPNTGAPFAGRSAIERMTGGDISDLDAVRRYLESVSGRLG